MLLCCASVAADEPKSAPHAGLLQELERLGTALEAARGSQDAETWRRMASETSIRMDSERLFERSEIRLSGIHPTQEMWGQLRLWAEAQGEQLPSAAQYAAWLRELKRALADFQRLGVEPPSMAARAHARGELDSILQQPAYVEVAQPRPGLAAKIAELIARYVFYPLFGPKRGTVAQKVVIVACLVILALLLAHTVWELWTAIRSGRPAAAARRAGARLPRVTLLSSAEELLARGDRLRADGRLLQAVGFYYLAMISYLAHGRCTQLDHSLTNWEHYQLAARCGRLQERDLRRLADLNVFFDEHCYGGREPSDASVEGFRSSVVEFRNAV